MDQLDNPLGESNSLPANDLLDKLLERRRGAAEASPKDDDTDESIDQILQTVIDAQDRSFGSETDDPENPIELEGEQLSEAKRLLFDELGAIIGDRGTLDKKIKLWRDLYDLEPGPAPYPGAPNFTTPLIRGKIAGFTANVRSALDKRPFFIADPSTAEGARSKPAWEATMEREVQLADMRRQIFMAVDEAAQVGTGILKQGVADANGLFVIQPKVVRLENWFISPPSVETTKQASTFERFDEPLHVFLRKTEKGVYDQDVARRVVAQVSTREGQSKREAANHGHPIPPDQTSDNIPVELWECYYRWGGLMYRVVVFRGSGGGEEVLRWKRSPFCQVDAIGESPPYVGLRPIPKPNYYYGDSYAMILTGIQGMNDWAMNALLAYNQSAITPGILIDEEAAIETQNSRSPLVYPGGQTKVRGNPNEVIAFYNPPQATNAERMIQMAQVLGNDATFYDYQLNGQPLGTVRSATEHDILRNASQVKLSEALKNVEYDLMDFAEMTWGLIDYYKVQPEGVYEVFQGQSDQYLLASEEVSDYELQVAFIEFAIIEGLMPPEIGQIALQQPDLLEQLGVPSLDIFIAGAQRGDLTWRPQGGETITDRAQNQNKHERLMANLGIIEAAQMLAPAWHIAKGYLESLEIQNWRDYLPAEPPDDTEMPLEQRAMIMAQVAEATSKMRMGGGQGAAG